MNDPTKNRFLTRPAEAPGWTDVLVRCASTTADEGELALVTSFGGGPDGCGCAEAARMVDLLNAAMDAFYRGERP